MPILATLYYKINLGESSLFLLGVGGGYYKGELIITEEASNFVTGNFKNEYKADGNTIGYHLKAEYNYLSGSMWSIYGGVLLRYAKINEFKYQGNTVKLNNKNVEGNFTGFLVYFGAGLAI